MEENNMKAKAMGKITIALFSMLIVSLFLTSCSGVVTPELQSDLDEEINKVEEIDYVYLDVPFEKYAGANWCLPASGAMTLKYFGKNIGQDEIASKVISNGSSSVFKFISFAKSLGFDTKYQSKTIEEIKVLLEEDIPVIAVQNYSLTLPYSHARVIIGFDDEKQEIITNDPTAGKDYKISYSDFLALNFDSNPDKCKVIVLSLEEVDTLNAELIDNTNNS
ncbi:MAG: C39 family peptidase [Candidatus Atribacteria bacterium]|nr:C39 family peptidase [Candidatus Atribacteria bacterium]